MVMSPKKCRAEHWDTMCFTVFTVSSGARPCLPTTHKLFVNDWLCYSACLWSWWKWWNQHWLCSPLVLICTMTFNLCVLAPLIRCHELLTLSASFTESTVSTRNRFGTPGNIKTRLSATLSAVLTCSLSSRADDHSPRSLLTLFFCRWPIKCHLISGHESKIWMRGKRNAVKMCHRRVGKNNSTIQTV